MITLQKLTWSNCFSYGENNELDLDSDTLTQIIGTNGTGKSSIPLIVEEVLYNKNSKGIKKAEIANRYMNNGYSISLSFRKDSSSYNISVVRKTNAKVVFTKDGEDISSHTATNTYKAIQEVLGIDFKTFSQLVYQNTNASLQFLTATDANRKKFLIDLLQLEKYVDLFEVFKEAHRESCINSNTATTSMASVNKWLKNNILEDTNILPMLDLEIDTSEDEKTLRSLTVELENISEKNKKILQNNQYRKMLQKIDITSLQKNQGEFINYDPLVYEYGSFKSVLDASTKSLKKRIGLGQECLACGQRVSINFKETMIAKEEKVIMETKEKINDLRERIESAKSENAKFKKTQDAIKEWEELYRNLVSDLPTTLLDKDSLESRISDLRDSIRSRKAQILSIAGQNEQRTKINTRIQVIQEQTKDFLNEKAILDKEIAISSKKENDLELLKKSFSTNGLIAYKIESLVKELEVLSNTYLGELSDGRFTLQFVINNDKLNVEITDNGNIVDILALSSGELARVNTATLLAIRKLMASISKNKINILFLDEVINVLDESGREKIVEVLLQEDDLNTYIVSHGWTHPLLEKIEVVRKGKVSGLE